jgi:hypothetical protein
MIKGRTWRGRAGLIALTALLAAGCSSNDSTVADRDNYQVVKLAAG